MGARAAGAEKRLEAARRAIALLRERMDGHFSVRLWDGSVEKLGANASTDLLLCITSPGVLPSLLRRPSLDRLIRHYAHGRIDIEGGAAARAARRAR